MDDRIIDFNDLKNKVKEKDVDKFENYIYGLYYSVAQGTMKMGDFTREVMKYMEENNISQEKLLNIQKKMMERYGVDPNVLDDQLKNLGINFGVSGGQNPQSYESIRKTLSFQEKYKNRMKTKNINSYSIKNDKNDVEIIFDGIEVLLKSTKKIDLNDIELNELLCSYKKVHDDKNLKIMVCENINEYDY